MCQIYHSQVVVQTLYWNPPPSYDPYLQWSSKCHRKDTLRTYGGVLRYWEVFLGFDRGPEEEYGLISENLGYGGTEMGLER